MISIDIYGCMDSIAEAISRPKAVSVRFKASAIPGKPDDETGVRKTDFFVIPGVPRSFPFTVQKAVRTASPSGAQSKRVTSMVI